LGLKTLFVKAIAQNENRENTAIILFKNIAYDGSGHNLVQFVASDGHDYVLERISLAENDVNVRCTCKDFQWRFNYFDHLDHSLYGKKRKKYEAIHRPGSANPNEAAGVCKHIMALVEHLKESGLIG